MKRIQAKNDLENYIYHTKHTINDDSIKSKLPSDKYNEIMEKLEKASEVLNVEVVSKDEYEAVQKEVEAIVNPVMNEFVRDNSGEFMNNPNQSPPPPEFTESEIPIDEID